MLEEIREDGSKRLRMDAYPMLFAHSAPPKRRKPPADRSVALQPSLASSLGDHSYASADDLDYQDASAGIFWYLCNLRSVVWRGWLLFCGYAAQLYIHVVIFF